MPRWPSGCVDPGADHDRIEAARAVRHDDPSWLPPTDAERADDATLARLALTVALRRHARPADTADGRTPGRDLSAVTVVVASGGVFRHALAGAAARRCSTRSRPTTPAAGGCRAAPRLTVDQRYVVAAAGLLADDHGDVAAALLRDALVGLG